MESITGFLEKWLRLRVSREKSAVAYILERSFLGYRLLAGGGLEIAPKSLERAKMRIRQITRRNRGVSLKRMIQDLNAFLPGWLEYFKLAAMKGHLQRLDERIFAVLYSEEASRPNAPVNVTIGAEIMKVGFGWSSR